MIYFRRFCSPLLFVALLAVPGTIWGATLNVPSTSYPTIQAAVNAAEDGDVIEVEHGKYVGALDIEIDSQGSGDTPTVTIHSNPGAIVKGPITVVNTTVDIDGIEVRKTRTARDNGIVLIGAHHSTIRNCIIRNFTKHGILIEGSDNVSVHHNGISRCPVGIGCTNSKDVIISQNSIAGNTDYGIFNYTSDTVDARDNWWGHRSGPSSQEGMGIGDAVSPYVLYDPWDEPEDEPTIMITRAYVTGFAHRSIIYRGEKAIYNIEYIIDGGSDYAKYRVFGKSLSEFNDPYNWRPCDPDKEIASRKEYVGKGAHTMVLTKRVPKCADVRTQGVSTQGVPYEMDGFYVDMRYRIRLKDLARRVLDADGWQEFAVFMVKKKQ